MPKMTAMDAAISILYNEGVRHIFGIPGAGILPFYKSMQKDGRIKHLICPARGGGHPHGRRLRPGDQHGGGVRRHLGPRRHPTS